MALHYCKRCGRVVERNPEDKKPGDRNYKCDYCNSDVYPVPEKYWLDGMDFLITNEQEALLREELVKTSPEFDEALFNRRGPAMAAIQAESDRAWACVQEIQAGKNSISCTYCGSTNVSKIGFFDRLGSTELWGLGSDKIGKQFHCNNCGANF